ncbi:hypothetical protein FJV76_21600 [Mesorhizobium sp. WSM4303]|uniref:hypothetical protein n=1 Tax=unclassified Mesorhizobium TaxID=325217 RepID=UPI00115D6EEB|nr:MULTISPECIES: hypothetical protein [unclassified Mesorhizobium]TRC85970.1 hypothetical protein FJV77_31345 [Mesorhizobium sp. WSM4306]TRD01624.1 hypothetical protein FJV76_21600 [Mesorhizobium sp. WSM4303]
MIRFIVKVCCGLLVFSLVCGCDLTGKSSAASTLTREERLKLATDAYFKNQCKNQWALLWPMAREGDGEALSELAFELGGGLKMPDSDMKVDMGVRSFANVLVMTIYAATASKYPDKRNLYHIFDPATWRKGGVTVVSIRSGLISYSSIKPPPPVSMTKLKNCLSQANSSAAGDRCVAQAIKLGLIPGFSEYSKAMDAVLTTYRPGSCVGYRPW